MSDSEKKRIAEQILRIRASQLKVNEALKAKVFKIPIHLAMGHEALAVAVSEIMSEEDQLLLTHRNIAYNLARAGELRPIYDEYLLESGGLSGGRLGSMNLHNPKRAVLYSSSILGNDFAVGTGVAMAERMLHPESLAIILGGDGSIEEGSFYESLTMLKSLQLGALVIIENNEWSLGTCISERRCPIDLKKLCETLNIPYVRLAGNDPYSYIAELKTARTKALEENTPVCIEAALTTLGDWIMTTPEKPEGKFVNYHAGATPSADIAKWPEPLAASSADPVFVLREMFPKEEWDKMAETAMAMVNKEIS